ncbi:AraC family transcriptional regulator [Tropicibacter sp. R16_0]|uniref:AraC family transcriptional regulator n=1 Tax=Tropicibacter sp. R16_0 TaxID=2821102 RepID=UPI001ADB8CA0|nr:AraC family transcriptional regulator [Tropicibacter sp. R16_0]MBO9449919.1 AraC family transcriptional regulator [Tropicibacter sp. R16_0]
MIRQRFLLNTSDEISEFLFDATGMIPGYTQFSAGPADLEYDVVDLDGVTLLWAQGISHCRWLDQMSDDGRVHFGFLVSAERGAVSLGHELTPEDAMLFLPGQEMDYVFLGPVVTLEIGVSEETAKELGWQLSGTPLSKRPLPLLQQLERVCRQATLAVSSQPLTDAGLAVLKASVLDALELALEPWLDDEPDIAQFIDNGSSAYRVLQKLDDLLLHPEAADVDVDAMAVRLGVSRRTLFYALRKSIGLTPRRYQELLRLQQLRQMLQTASSGDTTVTQLATDLGFSDLGRLSGKYRKQFGEYPHETLRN